MISFQNKPNLNKQKLEIFNENSEKLLRIACFCVHFLFSVIFLKFPWIFRCFPMDFNFFYDFDSFLYDFHIFLIYFIKFVDASTIFVLSCCA